MAFVFRFRFRLTGNVRINSSAERWRITTRHGEALVTPQGRESFSGAEWFVVKGTGFDSEKAALDSGERWRAAIERAMARSQVGADFGDRASLGGLTDAGKALMERESDREVRNEAPGVATYEEHAEPLFCSVSGSGSVGRSGDRLRAWIEEAREQDDALAPLNSLAFELYSASYEAGSADARFVMLVMAVETLIRPQPRAQAVQDFVHDQMAAVRSSDLAASEQDSIVGSLSWLLNESISQAGRRLAASLGDRVYMGRSPTRFLTECYALRSQLVHGTADRPALFQVDTYAAALERFVSDLLAGDLSAP